MLGQLDPVGTLADLCVAILPIETSSFIGFCVKDGVRRLNSEDSGFLVMHFVVDWSHS